MMEKISFKFSFSKNFNKILQKCLNWMNLKFNGLEWTKKKKKKSWRTKMNSGKT